MSITKGISIIPGVCSKTKSINLKIQLSDFPTKHASLTEEVKVVDYKRITFLKDPLLYV